MKKKNKIKREWKGAYASTVQRKGQEARNGYGQARRFWDQETWQEREARLREAAIPA